MGGINPLTNVLNTSASMLATMTIELACVGGPIGLDQSGHNSLVKEDQLALTFVD